MHCKVKFLRLSNMIFISGYVGLVEVEVEDGKDDEVCSVCQYHNGRIETIPSHECNINWTGK